MSRLRGLLLAVLLVAIFVVAFTWVSTMAALALGAVVALGGAAIVRARPWRTLLLVSSSVLLGLAASDLAFQIIDAQVAETGAAKSTTPSYWTMRDPAVGYRPQPGLAVEATATYGSELIFRATYTIEASGARATPGSGPDGPTYLFVGDSYIFGEGLSDSETLPSRFASALRPPAHVVNLGVLGHAPNHWVRAVETGLYDRHVVGKVAAVVTWVVPQQLRRVTGDAGWLADSPRFVLEDGQVRHTGTFFARRLLNPLAGIGYIIRGRFAWGDRVAELTQHQETADLYVALLARLKVLVQERYGAPLVVIYDWPDKNLEGQIDLEHLPTFHAIQALGVPLVSVRKIIGPSENWPNYFFRYDGHPNARLNREVAQALLEKLALPTKP